MDVTISAVVLRRYNVPGDWGDPVEAVAWLDDKSGQLRVLVADYRNGKRITLRRGKGGSKTSFTTVTP